MRLSIATLERQPVQIYTVLYRIESVMCPTDAPFAFVCFADDADHAEEQCLNAYPDCGTVWCALSDDYDAALSEYWQIEEIDHA